MAITEQNRVFLGTDGEHKIHMTIWEPDTDIKGVVQIVHGMKEHIGRYDDFAMFLASSGYAVAGHDHMGHGRTALSWGSYGYFGAEKGAKFLVEDSCKVTRMLAEKYKGKPLFLIGHSMGSFISRLQLLHIGDLLSGYICLGTAGYNPGFPLFRALMELICKIKGPQSNSLVADSIMSAITERCIFKEEKPDAWISHDRRVVDEYVNDPHTRFSFTNKGYCDLLDLMIACNSHQWYEKVRKTLPILLASGRQDTISRFGKDIPIIHSKLAKAGVLDVEYKLYENMRHEILNELDNQRVYDDLLNWIEYRI